MKKTTQKLVAAIIVSAASMAFCCSCQKQALPVPDYPLSSAAIENALKSQDFSWSVTEEEASLENKTAYTFRDEDEKMTGLLSSGAIPSDNKNDMKRFLQLGFPSSKPNATLTSPLPEEDFEKAVILAAVLYGGFEHERQLYENFKDTLDEHSEVKKAEASSSQSPTTDKEIVQWQNTINGIECQIIFTRYSSESGAFVNELSSVRLLNSEEFLP